jgi:hypothetical protein
MNAGKLIAYITAAILIFFGILFVWGAFSPDGSQGWILIGLVSVGVGFGLIWFAGRSKPAENNASNSTTIKIDLPGNVNLDTLKCKSCGGAITMDNIQMVAGAPVVSCPYCKSTYQLTEEPKW